jgi:hypothetical protein
MGWHQQITPMRMRFLDHFVRKLRPADMVVILLAGATGAQ